MVASRSETSVSFGDARGVSGTVVVHPAVDHETSRTVYSSPHFDVNLNTGERLGKNRRMANANNMVHHSATDPSHIVLPIVPHGTP
jgi:hypothetical protein